MTGGCLCGAIRFRVAGALCPVIGCHCLQCRKTSGHYVAATSALRDQIEIEGDVTWFGSSQTARRGFCATCGSSLFWDGPGENLSIHAGALDAPTGLALSAHIFVADKGDYYALDASLPMAEADDPTLTTMVV